MRDKYVYTRHTVTLFLPQLTFTEENFTDPAEVASRVAAVINGGSQLLTPSLTGPVFQDPYFMT
jgi:hypothetical protein